MATQMCEMFLRKIADDQERIRFVAFSCYRRRRLFDLDHPKKILPGVLNHHSEQMKANCVGFTVLPYHVHALIWLPETRQLSRFVHGNRRMRMLRK